MTEGTRILKAAAAGDTQAAEQLLPLVYEELRRIAARKMAAEQPGQTLDATALVHEAYVRLVDAEAAQSWNSRGHFFAAAAEAMRRILIEKARHKQSVKAGGEHRRQEFDNIEPAIDDANLDWLALNDVIDKLEKQDKRKADVVKLRFFVGMTIDEVAAALGISPATANNDWAFARCWLRLELESGNSA